MCGIVGLGATDLAITEINRLLRRMTDTITHRGPDDEGFYSSEGIGLGMRRLSIIDLVGGNQPIHNEDEKIQVVLNGEIYNYPQLRSDLEVLGHCFYTKADTEVIVHAYEQYGEGFLAKLRGMFSIALWDASQRALFLAVDRFGIKPLYYSCDHRGIIFGSELKALLATNRVNPNLNYEALAQYFTIGYIPAPQSAFQSVKKLSPGCFLRWTPKNTYKIDQYWDIQGIPRGGNCTDTFEIRRQLLDVLKDTVRMHLISDVPIGAFLSGGIDSSTIVALMSEISSRPVKTFSVGFVDHEHNELKYARLIADRFSTHHHELIVEPESVDILPNIVSHFDEPFADSSALPTYYVSKMTSQHVKVALSGDGGDELFVGYTIFRGVELARYFQLLPAFIRNPTTRIADWFTESSIFSRSDQLAVVLKQFSDSFLPADEAYFRKRTMVGINNISPLVSDEFRHQLLMYDPFQPFKTQLTGYVSNNERQVQVHPLEKFLYAGLKVSLPGDMLVKVDRMSMANSLEVRVPFLDHVLAEFAMAIPVQKRFPQWRLKGLLKDTMADMLPSEILAHPKHGFTVPLKSWFAGDLDAFTTDFLLSSEARGRGFLDPQGIECLLKGVVPNRERTLWSLLVFELWCRQMSVSL